VVTELRAWPAIHSLTAEDGRLTLSLGPGASAAPIVAMLVQNGIGVEEVRKARATLEDAFLDLMGLDASTDGGLT